MNQLQLSELVFALNSRIQPNDTGSPILRFFGRDVRDKNVPNSLNRNINWEILMQNRRDVHLRRVSRKGRGTKEIYSVGELCWVQNVKTKLWDRKAVITGLRTASDNTIVSYDIEIEGVKSTRHRKFLRKMNNEGLPVAEEAWKVPLADERVCEDGAVQSTEAAAEQSTVRRSPRLHSRTGVRELRTCRAAPSVVWVEG